MNLSNHTGGLALGQLDLSLPSLSDDLLRQTPEQIIRKLPYDRWRKK